MRILVTIGSMSEKKFTRLFKIIDELCEEGIIDGTQVIAQVGFDGYQSKNFECFDMTSDESFKKMIDDADLVITHAGTGTVTSSIKKGKKVIVFPRLAEYDEHYDDHQIELAELFSKQGYVLMAKTKEELKNHINNISLFEPAPFISNNDEISNMIIDFIEK